MPHDTYLIGYANKIAAIITAPENEDARRKLNRVMVKTQMWFDLQDLKFASKKDWVGTAKHIPTILHLRATEETLKGQKVVNYLGVKLDSRFTVRAQIQHSA